MSILSIPDLRAFLAREFPQIDGTFEIESAEPMRARMRLLSGERHLRPGGTISGPAMFKKNVTFYRFWNV